ncbi:hypothetical protein M9Y10_032529 [Tritrichomonas musculus]|uniref:Uncharacterized protein n=1 Tax=Tritrichomonas musculus TaxID=1915356 RepID=A0ABR2GYN5_9EUKA
MTQLKIDGVCKCKYENNTINDQGICVRPESKCNSNVAGCLICKDDDPNVCVKCDEQFNLDHQPTERLCTKCLGAYTLRANGQCLLPLDPIPSGFDVENMDVRYLSEKYAKSSEDGTQINVTTSNDLNQKDRMYAVELDSNVEQVNIENTLDNFELILSKEKFRNQSFK